MSRLPLKPRRPVLQPTHPQARGLVGAWPLWERGGLVRGQVSRRDLTLINGPTWTGGSVGPGLAFAGSQYGLSSDPAFNLRGDLTVSVVMETTNAVQANIALLARWTISDPNFILWTNLGQLRWGGSNSAAIVWAGGWAAVADGRPHVITATRSAAGTGALYVDGVLRASGSIAPGGNGSADLNLGNYHNNLFNPGGFTGTIYEARVYSRSLGAAEVRGLAADPWALYRPEVWRVGSLVFPFLVGRGPLRYFTGVRGGRRAVSHAQRVSVSRDRRVSTAVGRRVR